MKKAIARLLLLSVCLATLGGCDGRGEGSIGDDTLNTDEEEDFMEIWSENEPFVVMANDGELDTNGTEKDGSWFDSFQNTDLWTAAGDAAVRESDGQMVFTASTTAGGTASRSVTAAKNFEVEFRLRIKQQGQGTGFYITFGKERVMMYLSPYKVRLNSSVSTTDDCYMIEADVGMDWHTYKFVMYDGIVSAYMDGAFLMAYTPNALNSAETEFAFMGRAVAANKPCILEIEYVSYKVLEQQDLQILSPASAKVCGVGNTDIDVRIKASDTLVSDETPVELYLNDVYAGAVHNDAITLENLKPGVYRLYAKCGDIQTPERVFIIEKPASDAEPVALLSEEQKLQSSYILRYTVSGDAEVEADDGLYKFTQSYSSDDAGEYIAVVDGGVAWVYKNGKLQNSFRLPYGDCGSSVTTSGAVSNVKVEPHNATVFRKDFSDNSTYDADMGAIPYEYALEFEYTRGKAAEIRLNDGAYFLSIDINEDGTARGFAAPMEVVETVYLFRAAEETACYRVYVSSGLAQIFINNVWVKSLKLPQSYAARNLYVGGAGFGEVQIREAKDVYYWYADSSETEWNEYFCIDIADAAGTVYGHCLKNYACNAAISAVFAPSSADDGVFLLAARYDGLGKGIFAGYDFADGCFKIGTSPSSLQKLGTTALDTSLSEVTLQLVLEGNTARLYCDGTLIGEKTVSVTGWGNTGYYDTADVSLDRFAYTGDGGVLGTTTDTYAPGNHTVSLIELDGALYVCGETGTLLKSTDDGRTFTDIGRNGFLDKSYFNTVVAASGKIVSLVRVASNFGINFHAYISSDGGLTYDGPYRVNEVARPMNATVNAKFMQTASGRLVFVMENCYEEYNASAEIYYSDDDGVTWTCAAVFDAPSANGINLQEGAVVELDPGVLRLYIRTDAGFLYYTDSNDNGTTWEGVWTVSQFVSVMSAFNVASDPYTGDLYMVWEYNNLNDHASKKNPRSRVALAVSRDKGETWSYVGDVDFANSSASSTWIHMNLGVMATEQAVIVTAAKTVQLAGDSAVQWRNYMVRIDKASIVDSPRFAAVSSVRDPKSKKSNETGAKLNLGGTLIISSNGKHVWASGDEYGISEVNGKRTMLTAEMIASFMGGTLTVDGNTATITVMNARYVFTGGTQTAMIAGESREMIFEAVAEDGTVKVSVEDLGNLLDLMVQKTEPGAIVLRFDHTTVNLEYLLANAGMC